MMIYSGSTRPRYSSAHEGDKLKHRC